MIADEQLREALEVAFGAMQVLARQEPSFEIPRPLQPLLRFKKLTKTALATVRQVLEDNEAIRVAIGEALRAQGELEGGRRLPHRRRQGRAYRPRRMGRHPRYLDRRQRPPQR